MSTVEQEDCKVICDGAIKQNVASPKKTEQNGFEQIKGNPEKTFYNEIYLRKYEPEYV